MERLTNFLLALKPYLWAVIVIGIIVYAAITLKSCNKPKDQDSKADYFKQKGFKTDTIRIHDTMWAAMPYPVYLPPKEVKVYEPGKYQPPKHDTLWKHDTISLAAQTSNYNRLIYGKFTKDTLQLDMYEPDKDKIFTNTYLVDFNKYSYKWTNNGMTINENPIVIPKITSQRTPFFRYNGFYINIDRDFIHPNNASHWYNPDNVGFIGVFDIWRIKAQAFGFYPINGDKEIHAGVRLGYKLF